MELFPSIEVRAARIPDGIQRLRYLRSTIRGKRPGVSALHFVGAGLVGCLACFALVGPRKHIAPALIHGVMRKHVAADVAPFEPIWSVEEKSTYAVYSNGLQIRTEYTAASAPRRYRVFSRQDLTPSAERTEPAGIVFHTTESLLLPLEPARNGSLVRTREDLLHHVQNERCYNFVIDRFGQVFRVVPETQVAFHAGHSVWADAQSVYVNLNESFIGVAFEERTGTVEPSAAQLRSGRMLTDLLRSTYKIPEANCVTHAQVSVNPDNMRIGFHTDWAADFPFRELGLRSGYSLPVASIEVFGFAYDEHFLHAIGGHPWDGVIDAETNLLRQAAQHGVTATTYRQQLQQQYRFLRRNSHERTPESDRT